MALGQALQDRSRLDEAAAVFKGVTTSLNPRSAVAYWALGKVRAESIDEFDSDPEDPNDPSHCYEQAAKAYLEDAFQFSGPVGSIGRSRVQRQRLPQLSTSR